MMTNEIKTGPHPLNDVRIWYTGTAEYDGWMFPIEYAAALVFEKPDGHHGWRHGCMWVLRNGWHVHAYYTKARRIVVRIHGPAKATP